MRLRHPDQSVGIRVNVLNHVAARVTTGTESETMTLRPAATVAELVASLAGQGSRLATILSLCAHIASRCATRP